MESQDTYLIGYHLSTNTETLDQDLPCEIDCTKELQTQNTETNQMLEIKNTYDDGLLYTFLFSQFYKYQNYSKAAQISVVNYTLQPIKKHFLLDKPLPYYSAQQILAKRQLYPMRLCGGGPHQSKNAQKQDLTRKQQSSNLNRQPNTQYQQSLGPTDLAQAKQQIDVLTRENLELKKFVQQISIEKELLIKVNKDLNNQLDAERSNLQLLLQEKAVQKNQNEQDNNNNAEILQQKNRQIILEQEKEIMTMKNSASNSPLKKYGHNDTNEEISRNAFNKPSSKPQQVHETENVQYQNSQDAFLEQSLQLLNPTNKILKEFIEYVQQLDVRQLDKMQRQLIELHQRLLNLPNQQEILNKSQEIEIQKLINRQMKFLESINNGEIEDFQVEKQKYDQGGASSQNSSSDLQKLTDIFKGALEELEFIDQFYKDSVHVMLTTLQNKKDKKHYLFKIAKEIAQKQKPLIDLTANTKAIHIAIIEDYVLGKLKRIGDSVSYQGYKLPISVPQELNIDMQTISQQILKEEEGEPKVILINIHNQPAMVMKLAENFDGKNKKLLLGEIFTEEMVEILDKFVQGTKRAAILMPCVKILFDEIQAPESTYKQNRLYFKAFVEFVGQRMGNTRYIEYQHRDFKPANLALKNSRDGLLQRIIYIDTDDGKLVQAQEASVESSWAQANLISGGVTLPYLGPNMLLLYDLLYGQEEICTKQKFLDKIQQKIAQCNDQKYGNYLQSIKNAIEDKNEYNFNDQNKLAVAQPFTPQSEVEYIYNIQACIWPQIIRTAIDILVKGYRNRLAFLGKRNEQMVEEKLEEYIALLQNREAFLQRLVQEGLRDRKNLFQLACAQDKEDISELIDLLQVLLPLLKEEFDIQNFYSVWMLIKHKITQENILIEKFRKRHEEELNDSENLKFIKKMQKVYIRPKGKRLKMDVYTFDLETAVDKFLEDASKSVLLISGEGGGGKSLFIERLERRLWSSQQQYDRYGIPVYVKLHTLKNAVKDLMGEAFEMAGISRDKMAEFRQNKNKILLILDGYDELALDKKKNLYEQNQLNLWNCKVIITCRDEDLKENYQQLFQPQILQGLQEIYIATFDEAQVTEYLKKYVECSHIGNGKEEEEEEEEVKKIKWSYEEYVENIERINGIKDLIVIPIVLMMTAEVLPGIVHSHEQQVGQHSVLQITKNRLYEEFMNRWFKREENKLKKQEEWEQGISNEFWHYAMTLACRMFEDSVWEFSRYPKVRGKPASYFDALFADPEEYPPPKKERVFHALPLKRNKMGNYNFWHASFVHFFRNQRVVRKTGGQYHYSFTEVQAFIGQARQKIQTEQAIELATLEQQQMVHAFKLVVEQLDSFNENIKQLIMINEQKQQLIAENIVKQYIQEFEQQRNLEISHKFFSIDQLNINQSQKHIVAQTVRISQNQFEIHLWEGLIESAYLQDIVEYELYGRVEQLLIDEQQIQDYRGYLYLGAKIVVKTQQQQQPDDDHNRLFTQALKMYEFFNHKTVDSISKDYEASIEEKQIQEPDIVNKLLKMEKKILTQLEEKQISSNELTDVALYVPSQCSTYLGAPHSFDLVDKFEEYLDKQSDGQQLKVLLLMGDSGSGKTSFSERFVIKRNSIPKKQELAVYISLPTIRDTTFILEEFLEGYAFSEDEIQQLQQTQSFLFVLDGYDELARCFNIYDSNGFQKWIKSRFVIVSRTQQFARFQKGCEDYLYPHKGSKVLRNLVKELYIKPFSQEQRLQYINEYAKHTDWAPEVYEEQILQLQLEELVQTPFALKLALRTLPSLIRQVKSNKRQRVGVNAIYEEFAIQWFERELAKYEEAKQNKLSDEQKTIKIQQWKDFSVDLASQLSKHSITEIAYRPSKDQQLDEWKEFFASKDEERRWALRACPLMVRVSVNEEDQEQVHSWRFLHKSFQEYFTVQRCSRSSVSTAVGDAEYYQQVYETEMFEKLKQNLNVKVQDVSELSFEVESLLENTYDKNSGISQEDLFRIVYASSEDKSLQVAASNSMTILNAAGVPFNGLQLQGISIPGANLSYAIINHTILDSANLEGVNFTGAYVYKSDLSNANLKNVQYGERPVIGEINQFVTPFAFHPNEQILFITDNHYKNAFTIWNQATGTMIDSVELPESVQCNFILISQDTQKIVVQSNQKKLFLYVFNQASEKKWQLHQVIDLKREGIELKNNFIYLRSVAFSHYSDQLVAGDGCGTVFSWNYDTQQQKWVDQCIIDDSLEKEVKTINYFPNETHLLIASTTIVKILNLQTKQSETLVHLPEERVQNATCSAQSIVAGIHQDIWLWSWDTSQQRWVRSGTLQGHTQQVSCVALSPTGSQLVSCSGGADATIRLWDIQFMKQVDIIVGHKFGAYQVEFAATEELIVSAGYDHTIKQWDISKASVLKQMKLKDGHNSSIYSILYSPDGKQFATRSWDGTIIIWDAVTYKQKKKIQTKTESVVDNGGVYNSLGYILSQEKTDQRPGTFMVYSEDGAYFITSRQDNIYLWSSGTCKIIVQAKIQPEQIKLCRFKYLQTEDKGEFVCINDKQINIWQYNFNSQQQQWSNKLTIFEHNYEITRIVYSQDGSVLAAFSHDDGVLSIVDSSKQKLISQFQIVNNRGGELQFGSKQATDLFLSDKRHQFSGVACIQFSNDNQFVVSAGEDSTIRIWSVADGEQLGVLIGHINQVNSVSISPDSKYLASVSIDNRIAFWDLNKLERIQVIKAHTDEPSGLVASKDWNTVISVSQDQTIKIWKRYGHHRAEWMLEKILAKSCPLTFRGTIISLKEGISEYEEKLLESLGGVYYNFDVESPENYSLLPKKMAYVILNFFSQKKTYFIQINNKLAEEEEHQKQQEAIEYFNRGVEFKDQQNYEMAFQNLSMAIKTYPQLLEAYLCRADLFLQLGRPQQVIEDCSAAIRINPEAINAYALRCTGYQLLNRNQDAIEELNQLISKHEPLLTEVVEDQKEKRHQEIGYLYRVRSNAYRQMGQLEQAISDISSAIEIYPKLSNQYIQRAVMYKETQQFNAALQDITQAIQKDLMNSLAYNVRSGIYDSLGQVEDAQCDSLKSRLIEHFKKKGITLENFRNFTFSSDESIFSSGKITALMWWLRQVPNLRSLILIFEETAQLGDNFFDLLEQLKKLENLKYLFLEGVERNENYQKQYLEILKDLKISRQGDEQEEDNENSAEEQEQMFQGLPEGMGQQIMLQLLGLLRQPQSEEATDKAEFIGNLKKIAQQYEENLQNQKAANVLKFIVDEIQPKNASLRLRLGILNLKMEKHKEALEQFEHLINLGKYLDQAYFNAGIVLHLELRDYAKAELYYIKSYEIVQKPNVLQQLVGLYLLTEQLDKAENFLKKAVTETPSNLTLCEYARFLLHQKKNYSESLYYIDQVNDPQQSDMIFYTQHWSNCLDEVWARLLQGRQRVVLPIVAMICYLKTINNFYLTREQESTQWLGKLLMLSIYNSNDEIYAELYSYTQDFLDKKKQELKDEIQITIDDEKQPQVLNDQKSNEDDIQISSPMPRKEEDYSQRQALLEANECFQQNEQKNLINTNALVERQRNENISQQDNKCICCILFYHEGIQTMVNEYLQKQLNQKMILSQNNLEIISDEQIIEMFQKMRCQYGVRISILDEQEFNEKIDELREKCSDESWFVDSEKKMIKAFTYNNFRRDIHVAFRKNQVSRHIAQHELRRVRQLLERDYSMLRAYLEGFERQYL